MDFPDCLLLLLSISVFLLFSFSVFLHFFSCWFRAVDKLTYVGFRAHVKIASRIVSYRIDGPRIQPHRQNPARLKSHWLGTLRTFRMWSNLHVTRVIYFCSQTFDHYWRRPTHADNKKIIKAKSVVVISSKPMGSRASRKQEAQLSPSDRAMRLVSSNLANCHATVQKLLIRQVLTKLMV